MLGENAAMFVECQSLTAQVHPTHSSAPQSRQQRRLDAIVQVFAHLGIFGQALKQPRHDLHAAEAHGLLGRLAVRQKVPGVSRMVSSMDGRRK